MYRPCYAPTFPPATGLGCALIWIRMAILIALLLIVLAITFGNEGILCMIRRARYRMNHCTDGNSDPNIDLAFTLDRWIMRTPYIRDGLIWRPDEHRALNYSDWSDSDKELLASLYDRLKESGEANLPVEPAIDAFLYYSEGRGDRGNRLRAVAYSASIAKETFFAHVAQSLCVEINSIVPWSLSVLSAPHLAYLLDSRHMYGWSSELDRHVIELRHGRATPGDPGRVFQFLDRSAIIVANEQDTIVAMLEWCRRMYHDYGVITPDGTITLLSASRDGNEVHWQYEGYQPAERTIAGTVRTGSAATEHWTGGCQGTTGFLRNVLRTINIPVAREDGCRHAIPHFLNVGLFISHGDDPYNLMMKNWIPQIPMSEILLSVDRLPGFFDNCDHVGRGVAEAVARLLPDDLIQMHCDDLENGLGRTEGTVDAYLSRYFDEAWLTRELFWERLEAELSDRGGCDGLI